MSRPEPTLNRAPRVSDEVRKTTCYMCACRCGINVHLKEGRVTYIEGNRDHPVNKGVLCAKGSAGIMQHYSPARLRAPMKRVGPRGSGEFEEITWDEALEIAKLESSLDIAALTAQGPFDLAEGTAALETTLTVSDLATLQPLTEIALGGPNASATLRRDGTSSGSAGWTSATWRGRSPRSATTAS